MVSTKWRLLVVTIAVLTMEMVSASQEVLKQMSVGFSKVLQTCKTELSVGDHIIQDFYNYWREDYDLLNRDFGCMVICMAVKHDLINDQLTMHHGNAHAFAKTHGADDDTAQQLVTILRECEAKHQSVEDVCNRALEMAKCFRTKIHELKWAPAMEVVLEEIMTSV
uniref:Pheromone binding protein 2 n=1 Tax=Manduca sexta TaxID=7130 RepID=Q9U500_MANSE|nr:pheromone binding protein 2 [Manduca sexta]